LTGNQTGCSLIPQVGISSDRTFHGSQAGVLRPYMSMVCQKLESNRLAPSCEI
jgi:hypothetical protein